MKKNYFLKGMLLSAAIFGATSLFAQTVKQPEFTNLLYPVHGSVYEPTIQQPGPEMFDFGFAYENAAAWGDYNNDGLLDFITAGVGHGWSRQVLLYKNNGDGTFTYQAETPFPGLQAASATWLDYNNDGNLDLFLTGKDDVGKYSGLWKNLGAPDYEFEEVFFGDFEHINNEGGNRNSHYVAVADYNNDGWVDLYLQGHTLDGQRWSGLYKNLAGAGFELIERPIFGINPLLEVSDGVQSTWPMIQMNGSACAWGDYNNDGLIDLLANGYWNGTLNPNYDPLATEGDASQEYHLGGFVKVFYLNKGDGTFEALVLNKQGTDGDVAWFDFNNDGYLDYIITQWGNTGTDNFWISDIYENNQNGTFTLVSTAEENGMPQKQECSIAIGDVNNDGFADVLYMNANPNSIFLNNSSDGTFAKQVLKYEGLLKEVKDENDVVIAMEPRDDNTLTQWGGTACLVDFDNDGDLDAITAAYGYEPILLRNDLGEGIPVNAAPSVPTNLQATTADGLTTFSWDASTDDLGSSVTYNLYVKQGDKIISVLPADLATGRLKVNELIAPLTTTFYSLTGLTGEYEWGVSAIDNAKNASVFAVFGGTGIADVKASSVRIINTAKAIKLQANAGLNGVISVYNVTGAQVYGKAGEINGTTVVLPTGVYLVKVDSVEGVATSKAVVK